MVTTADATQSSPDTDSATADAAAAADDDDDDDDDDDAFSTHGRVRTFRWHR
jgi:hypothetical protein